MKGEQPASLDEVVVFLAQRLRRLEDTVCLLVRAHNERNERIIAQNKRWEARKRKQREHLNEQLAKEGDEA